MMDKITTDHRSPKKKNPCRLVSFDEVAVVFFCITQTCLYLNGKYKIELQ